MDSREGGEKLNTSLGENPQPSLFDDGPADAPALAVPAPEQPPEPRDATRAEKEEIVYLNLSELFPFKDHPFGVRWDIFSKISERELDKHEKLCHPKASGAVL